MRRGFAAILLVGLIALFAILGTIIYLQRNNKLPTFNSPANQSALQSSPAPTPDETTNPDSIGANWKTYESGELILNSDFSITYPQGWHFKYREDKSIGYLTDLGATRMEFDISPPEWKVGIGLNEWSGYTSIAVEIYPQSSTLNKWISSFLPKYENRLIIENKKIGNKTAYLLKGKPDPNDSIDLAAGFAHRYVVLGERHSYVVGFGNDGTVGSIERMQNEIFPGFRFID